MDVIQLADAILEALKRKDDAEISRLAKQIPEEYTLCFVNMKAAHPSVVIVLTEDVSDVVEGLHIWPDGGVTRKRALVTD